MAQKVKNLQGLLNVWEMEMMLAINLHEFFGSVVDYNGNKEELKSLEDQAKLVIEDFELYFKHYATGEKVHPRGENFFGGRNTINGYKLLIEEMARYPEKETFALLAKGLLEYTKIALENFDEYAELKESGFDFISNYDKTIAFTKISTLPLANSSLNLLQDIEHESYEGGDCYLKFLDAFDSQVEYKTEKAKKREEAEQAIQEEELKIDTDDYKAKCDEVEQAVDELLEKEERSFLKTAVIATLAVAATATAVVAAKRYFSGNSVADTVNADFGTPLTL